MQESLKDSMERAAADVESLIAGLLPETDDAEAPLWRSMRYGSLGGGKRLRPYLVLEGAGLFDVPRAWALRTAAAVELIHCYSLIHDDLPAMDDADLRRGRPTVHRAFDEATAVLAGDGLLTMAFEVLSDPDTHPDPAIRCALNLALARAAGPRGMVGGQMIDLIAETTPFDLDEITRLQRLKTGALFGFACLAGSILGQAGPAETAALRAFADDLGLAFQIADDLLDVEGDEAEVGKTVGHDAAAGKATFVSLLGVEGARARARALADSAVARLDLFDRRADRLRAVARFTVERRS